MLIGLDGGATEFKAHQVELVQGASRLTLARGPRMATVRPPQCVKPVDLERQIRERDDPRLIESEIKDGAQWVWAASKAVAQVASGRKLIRLGVCMPGLKTQDELGISAMRNGPRIPQFASLVQAMLAAYGIKLEAPIPRLIGDGEACGLGERLVEGGCFRDVKNAYYIGGGTGVAEALMMDGIVRALASVPLRRAWEMPFSEGGNLEDCIAMKRMNTRFEILLGRKIRTKGELEAAAMRHDEAALRVFHVAVSGLAQLIRARHEFFDGGSRSLRRVVLGQHTGRLYNDPRLRHAFKDPLLHALDDLHGLQIVGSDLRAAPAIGAAATAL